MKSIGDRIEEMLAERRLTRAELARRAHMRRSTLQSIMETPNRSPRADTIQKLAMALDVDHTWLATGRHSSQKDLAVLTEDDRNAIAQALTDAIQKKAPSLGAAARAALISEFLTLLEH